MTIVAEARTERTEKESERKAPPTCDDDCNHGRWYVGSDMILRCDRVCIHVVDGIVCPFEKYEADIRANEREKVLDEVRMRLSKLKTAYPRGTGADFVWWLVIDTVLKELRRVGVEYTNGHTFKKDLKPMTPRPQPIIFDRKEFLDFLEWVGVTGEVSTTESGEEAFTLFGNMGNIFTLDVISNSQADWDTVLKQLHNWFENYCEGNEEPDLWMAFLHAERAFRKSEGD